VRRWGILEKSVDWGVMCRAAWISYTSKNLGGDGIMLLRLRTGVAFAFRGGGCLNSGVYIHTLGA